MSEHTQGRMTINTDKADGWPLLMIGSRIVANVNTESGVDTSKAPSIAFKPMPAEANARRLVACWNACEGLHTESLERGKPLADQLVDALTQRDELLAALRPFASVDLRSQGVHQRFADDVLRARAAIAKSTGGAL
jgi:hypothetical protein